MNTLEKTTEVLNDLVKINNDRIAGYQKAIQESKTEDADLKVLFSNMIRESEQYKAALTSEIMALGDPVDSGTTNSGKIYRAWMDIKAVFTGHDRKSILENCEFGEDAAQKAYKTALQDEDLTAEIRALILEQQVSLRASHDKIKALRDSQV